MTKTTKDSELSQQRVFKTRGSGKSDTNVSNCHEDSVVVGTQELQPKNKLKNQLSQQ